jgi:hypothetical protein
MNLIGSITRLDDRGPIKPIKPTDRPGARLRRTGGKPGIGPQVEQRVRRITSKQSWVVRRFER